MQRQILYLFMITCSLSAQEYNFEKVDEYAKSLPSHYKNSKELAMDIDNSDTLLVLKLRTLFTWMTENIGYDVESYETGKRPSPLPVTTLKTGVKAR